jgi:serine protease AprX
MSRLRFLLVSGLIALGSLPVFAGERIKVWVELAHKGPAVSATSGRAFEDAPVYAPCLTQLRAAGVEIVAVLKWQNRVSGWVNASRTGTVAGLSCVRGVEEMPRKAAEIPLPDPTPSTSSALAKSAAQNFGAFQTLFNAVGAGELRDTVAARGKAPGAGVRIAIMDADFMLGHQAFDSLYARGGIVDQWDYVGNSTVAVSRTLGNSHGAQVLSQIAGDLPGVLQGLAPYARFQLYRTEDEVNERYVEEDYLAAAFERAVDSGAQVISISLGYRYDFDSGPNYPYSQMNGRTRPSSIAAVAAARRGALVVVAIGNENATREGAPTVTAPSDADSILAVGAVNTSGARCSYSSTGPSYDGRIKPEVSSLGCSMPLANSATTTATWNQSGTSFAAPVVAGVAALLRQLHPDSVGVSAQNIRWALMATGAGAAAPDNLTGNGLIRAAAAHRFLLPGPVTGIMVGRDGRRARIGWANVNPARAQAWDFLGRSRTVEGTWSPEGDVLITTPQRMAPGAYILKIPPRDDTQSP